MAIGTVVTRGFGNGVLSGSIPLVVTRGFGLGVAPVIHDASGVLTGSGLILASAQALREASGTLTGTGTLTATLFEGPSIRLIGQHGSDINLAGSI